MTRTGETRPFSRAGKTGVPYLHPSAMRAVYEQHEADENVMESATLMLDTFDKTSGQ